MPDKIENALSHLGFRRFKPSKKLANFIDCYWFINTKNAQPLDSTEYLHPDGGMGIILNYGDPFFQLEKSNQAGTCMLDGTNTITRALGFNGIINSAGIRFKTAAAGLFFSHPLNELKNETASLGDIHLKHHSSLYYNLDKAKTYHEKIATIENWLYRCIQPEAEVSKVVMASIQLMNKNKGISPISKIAQKLDYSPRKIERLFRSQVGISPKEYSRILRIDAARTYMKHQQNMSLADIAYHLEFYDQAHFIHQFKQVVGMTPREYTKTRPWSPMPRPKSTAAQ